MQCFGHRAPRRRTATLATGRSIAMRCAVLLFITENMAACCGTRSSTPPPATLWRWRVNNAECNAGNWYHLPAPPDGPFGSCSLVPTLGAISVVLPSNTTACIPRVKNIITYFTNGYKRSAFIVKSSQYQFSSSYKL